MNGIEQDLLWRKRDGTGIVKYNRLISKNIVDDDNMLRAVKLYAILDDDHVLMRT
jgi:hypothetical protein